MVFLLLACIGVRPKRNFDGVDGGLQMTVCLKTAPEKHIAQIGLI
jgi:hypothetical protein